MRVKKIITRALATVMAFAMAVPTGIVASPPQVSRAAEVYDVQPLAAGEAGGQEVNISNDWKFYKGSQNGAEGTNFDDSSWQNVNIPHTWNAADGADGGGNYYRGDGWYRKTLKWDDAYDNKRVYIQFLGANMQADVYVNGTKMGTHKGGYTAFRYDITGNLKPNQDNILAVKVNNSRVEDIAPLEADFTFYGGLYREISLILTEDVHVDTMDYASSSLKLTTSNVSKSSAKLNVKSKIVNDSKDKKKVYVKAVLREPEKFEEVEGITPLFDVSSMAGTRIFATEEASFDIDAGKSADFSKDITVNNPRLWNGLKDPYRYQVDLTITVDGKVVDKLTDYVGFRYFNVDYNKGFFLNGESYPLRGVCRHQDREGMGNALTKNEHDEDFSLIYEIGANAIRLAHYPQDPYFYELCDKYGIVVWAEIPFVNLIGGSGSYENPNADRKAFFDVTKQQLIEMIRQQYNHPSICFWGLQNEVRVTKDSANDNDVMKKFMQELMDLAHKEDPTGRLTVQATDKNEAKEWPSDLQAWNRYPGWYFGNNQQWGSTYDELHRGEPARPMGASEYGIGSNINHHTENPTQNAGAFQSEEYQCISNELFIKDINEREYLWGTFYWNMFDFGSDGRSEGGLKGINTKGLVTFDRKTPKDVFYLYKACWSSSPFAYIASRRFTSREKANIEVKVYSNCDSVTLYMNGKEIGTLTQNDLAQKNVYKWENILLAQTENKAYVVGKKGDQTFTDTVIWKRAASDATTIQSDVLRINENNKTVQLNQDVYADKLTEAIASDANAFPSVYEDRDGMLYLVESGQVEPGMVLRVTSEDRTNNDYYTFVPGSLAYKKTAKATNEENKEGAVNLASHAVDGKEETRWAANDSNFPRTITVDLGAKEDIRKINTTWFKGGDGKRSYEFKISVSDDNNNFTQVVDRSNNTTVGYVADSVNTSGRYVKIEVTGASSSGNASIYEIDVFGTDYPEIKPIGENETRLEAENAQLSGKCGKTDSYVKDVGNGADNKVTFTVQSNTAGKATMDLYYITKETRDFEVKVNGGAAQKVTCPGNNVDWTSTVNTVSIGVELKAGDNTIEVGNASAYAPNLDCIVVKGVLMDRDPQFPDNSGDIQVDPTIDEPGEGMVMYRVDGESGDMQGGAEIYTSGNDKYVYQLEGNGTVSYKIVGDTEETRKLRIYYCHQFGSKLKVIVNGNDVDEIDVAPTGAFFSVGAEPIRLDIQLKKGVNEIVFAGVDGSDAAPYIDYFNIELTEEEVSQTEKLETKPGTTEPGDGDENPPEGNIPGGSDPNQGGTNLPGGSDPNQGETKPPESGDQNQGGTKPPEGDDPNQGGTNPPGGSDPNQGGTNPPGSGEQNTGGTNPPGSSEQIPTGGNQPGSIEDGDEEEKSLGCYTVINARKKTAKLVSVKNKKARKLNVPETVEINGVTCKVVEVGTKVMKGNTKLTKVTLGKNVTTISKNAFYGCKKLKTVQVKGKVLKTIKGGAFKRTSAKLKVTAKKLTKSQKVTLRKKIERAGNKRATVK